MDAQVTSGPDDDVCRMCAGDSSRCPQRHLLRARHAIAEDGREPRPGAAQRLERLITLHRASAPRGVLTVRRAPSARLRSTVAQFVGGSADSSDGRRLAAAGSATRAPWSARPRPREATVPRAFRDGHRRTLQARSSLPRDPAAADDSQRTRRGGLREKRRAGAGNIPLARASRDWFDRFAPIACVTNSLTGLVRGSTARVLTEKTRGHGESNAGLIGRCIDILIPRAFLFCRARGDASSAPKWFRDRVKNFFAADQRDTFSVVLARRVPSPECVVMKRT